MIKALILDYGNVISLTDTEAIDAVMAAETGLPAEAFGSLCNIHRNDFDRGIISGEEMYSRLLQKNGYTKEAEDAALLKKLVDIDLAAWRVLNDAVCEWALNIQKQGFKLGILSNMPYQFLDRYEKEIPPFVAADYACFSCRLHLIKPEPEIYRNCLEGLGIRADEAVFFDDLERNITAAKKLGFHGFVWTGVDQAQKDWLSCL
ncbi:HAD hydrolase, family IA, variant 3 [Treponema vincentii ATCC 35580]|uniref:HAD hydrolase, family IA, variant 3 n=1 Tax=Treponema vincentii ATCC 35580 TaxID=596324 RepID=C8PSK9_9SPIR|nr:HAD family phosphatase [Treponema vincentii]EEV19608.1 HAD hydrolase, family IA, variant 3 [Treponema vincentii ATCC 35580]